MGASRVTRIKLASGRESDPNGGFVGLNQSLDVAEGYDGALYWEDPEYGDNWTNDEKSELADIMIKRWQDYKAKWSNG